MVMKKHDELKACKFKAQYHSQVFRDIREAPRLFSDPPPPLSGPRLCPIQPNHILWPSLWKWKVPDSWRGEAEDHLKLQEELKPLEAWRVELSSALVPLRRFDDRPGRHVRQFLRQLFFLQYVGVNCGTSSGIRIRIARRIGTDAPSSLDNFLQSPSGTIGRQLDLLQVAVGLQDRYSRLDRRGTFLQRDFPRIHYST